MSVSAVSSSADYWQSYFSQKGGSVGQQSSADFQELGQALQTGDLSGAQQAFSALQQLMMTGTSSSSQTQGVTAATGTDSIGSDLSALTQAIQSGNQADMKTDLAKLTQDLQSLSGKGHHHHHHHQVSGDSQDGDGLLAASSGTGSSSAADKSTQDSSISSSSSSSASAINAGTQKYLMMIAVFQSSSSGGLNLTA